MTRRETPPLVSIGLPVYNGEKYLAEALDSILGQTLTDIEVVISDNASTDRTAEICQAYVARDPRVRYFRQASNLGAAPNFNFVFSQTTGRFFKWAAYDDVCAPTLLERCVAALEERPDRVAAYSLQHTIDDVGDFVEGGSSTPDFGSEEPHIRVATALSVGLSLGPQWVIFGVLRRCALQRTRLLGSYSGSDRTLFVELALQGPLYEIDDVLFFERDHSDRSIQLSKRSGMGGHAREAWFDTSRAGKIVFPRWRRLGDLVAVIASASIPMPAKVRSFGVLSQWLVRREWKRLAYDVQQAALVSIERARRRVSTDG